MGSFNTHSGLSRLHLVLVLMTGFLMHSISFAQTPTPDCSNCPCVLPGILGTTLSANPGIPAGATQTFNNVPFANTSAGTYARFYAHAGSEYLVSVCTESHNTVMYLTNPSGGKVACDDDGCGISGGPSHANFHATQTGLYRIYIFNTSCPTAFPVPTNITVTITRILHPIPANNLPCDAVSLFVVAECNVIEGTTLGATNSATTLDLANNYLPIPGCLYQGGDVWYSAVIPQTGAMRIDVEAAEMCSPAFAVFSSNDCTAGPFVQLGDCTDPTSTGIQGLASGLFDAASYSLSPDDPVLIRVWERNGNEHGSFTICAYEAEPISPVSVSMDLSTSDLKLWPNPADELINIKLGEGIEGRTTVRIMDTNGRLVRSMERTFGRNVNTVTLPVADLSAGMYLIHIENGGSVSTHRFMRQ